MGRSTQDGIHLMVGILAALLSAYITFGLPLAVVVIWTVVGWNPATIPDEPLDFAALTIAGIPIEELDLPTGEPLV